MDERMGRERILTPLLLLPKCCGYFSEERPKPNLRASRGDVVHGRAEMRDDARLYPGFFPDFSPYGVIGRLAWSDASRRYLYTCHV